MIFTGLLAAMSVVVALLGWVGWQVASQKDALLSTPGTIGSLRLDSSDDGRAKAAQLRGDLSAVIELNATVGAVYLDGTGRIVFFFGGTKSFWAPGSVLESVLAGFADNAGAVLTEVHSVGTGTSDGVMRCGRTRIARNDLTVCGWADHGSVAMAMFTDRDEPESAQLLRQMKSASLTRSR